MTIVYFAVEGRTDVPIAKRLIQLVKLQPQQAVVAGGKSKLDPRIPALNRSGTHLNWLVLRDLDSDAPCASQLIRDLVGQETRSPRIALRVPIRAIESWLLADDEGFAREFSIHPHNVPDHPESLDNPKRSLVELCRHSRKSEIRAAMVPRPGSGRNIGPEYTYRISTFAGSRWDPERASENSPSLRRTITALQKLVDAGIWT